MLGVTMLTRLTNDELLYVLVDVKNHSPVIGLLCSRLAEAIGHTDDLQNQVNHNVECPVCMAQLTVEFDHGNRLYNLKIDKD